MQGGVKLKCEVKLKGVFYLFNRIGAYALIGPGVELGVSGTFKLSGGQGPQTQTQNQVQGCAAFDAVVESKYGLEAALGFLGNYKREYPLGTPFLLSLPFPLSRCAQNYTPVDSCAGKENGKAFCSSIDSRDSFSCNNNVSAGGNSCAIGQFCQSEGGSMGGAAIMEGTTAQCGTNPPRPADLSLSFCPSAVEALPRETE